MEGTATGEAQVITDIKQRERGKATRKAAKDERDPIRRDMPALHSRRQQLRSQPVEGNQLRPGRLT